MKKFLHVCAKCYLKKKKKEGQEQNLGTQEHLEYKGEEKTGKK